MVDGLKSDSYWYSRGEVRQVGSMAYSGLTVTRKDVDSATVVVKVDASGVTLTAEGDEIEFDQGQANQLELFLIMDDKSSMWLVDQVQATRQ